MWPKNFGKSLLLVTFWASVIDMSAETLVDGGAVDYNMGAEGLYNMTEFLLVMMHYVTMVLYCIASLTALVNALQIYIKMNQQEALHRFLSFSYHINSRPSWILWNRKVGECSIRLVINNFRFLFYQIVSFFVLLVFSNNLTKTKTMCLKNKIVSGAKTAYRKFINSTLVQRCIILVLTVAVGVGKIFAQATGGQGYEAGKNAISQASEQIAQYVPIATKLCYAIAGVVAIVGAISVYVKMNNEEQDVKKSIMMIIGACVFLIAAAQALPLFFGIEDGVLTGF